MLVAFIITLVSILGLLLLINLITHTLGASILFSSTSLKRSHKYKFKSKFSEETIKTKDDGEINTLLFNSFKEDTKGLIIYLHGNSTNLVRWGIEHKMFCKRGYDFLVYDYRGFGKSKGKLSQESFYEDALAVYDHFTQQYEGKNIIVYGRSLGTSVATYIAAHRDCHQLILETPFFSIKDIFYTYYSFLPKVHAFSYEFPTYKYLKKVKAVTTVFHGRKDKITPYESAFKLQPMLKSNDNFITFDEGHHHNIKEFNGYKKTMNTLLD